METAHGETGDAGAIRDRAVAQLGKILGTIEEGTPASDQAGAVLQIIRGCDLVIKAGAAGLGKGDLTGTLAGLYEDYARRKEAGELVDDLEGCASRIEAMARRLDTTRADIEGAMDEGRAVDAAERSR